jgi:hypothetical protein
MYIMDIVSICIVVGALYGVFTLPVGLFNMKMYQAVHGYKCAGSQCIALFFPFYNIAFARKLVYGRSMYGIWVSVCMLFLLFRIASLLLVTIVPVLVVFSAITILVFLCIYYLLYVINALDFCMMLGCGILTFLCCIIITPVGYMVLSTQAVRYFKSVEDEVSGRFTA